METPKNKNKSEDWKKVINTTDKADCSASLMKMKKVQAFQNDILNPKEMRDLILKKRLKL